jgi:hypothetical protein
MKVALVLLALPIACSDGQQASRAGADQTNVIPAVANAQAQPQSYSCGGTTDLATVERYFADLGQALAQPGLLSRFNRFVGAQFAVTPRRGPTLYFNLSDVGSVTPAYITVAEWREIHRRGERSLNGAGYRGCFMDHGKVWFEGSREDGLRLMGIARDMPWVPLAESRSRL